MTIETQPTKVAGTLRRAVRSWILARIHVPTTLTFIGSVVSGFKAILTQKCRFEMNEGGIIESSLK
jgi:hypothetical protein